MTADVAHPTRPCFCYLEVPAIDAHQSAAFYQNVFGWNIRHSETPRPSFDDAAGHISGAFVTGRTMSGQPGLLPYIWVDDIAETLAKVEAADGQVIDGSHPDHPGSTCHIARFRDPAGNVIGLYQEDVG